MGGGPAGRERATSGKTYKEELPTMGTHLTQEGIDQEKQDRRSKNYREAVGMELTPAQARKNRGELSKNYFAPDVKPKGKKTSRRAGTILSEENSRTRKRRRRAAGRVGGRPSKGRRVSSVNDDETLG